MNRSRRRLARAVATLAALALLLQGAVGCFGRFELTRKVYRFNQQVDNDKWIQWFAFLVLNVVPVYGLAGMLDVLFANSVEFWTGRNPVTAEAGTTRFAVGPNGERAVAVVRADGSLDLSVHDANGALHSVVLVPTPDGGEARDPQGNLLARFSNAGGTPRILQR